MKIYFPHEDMRISNENINEDTQCCGDFVAWSNLLGTGDKMCYRRSHWCQMCQRKHIFIGMCRKDDQAVNSFVQYK